tara:strand:+ start:942 stop:3221 length:2280 start_codon:yes stop_codon:yes gene_type:complete
MDIIYYIINIFTIYSKCITLIKNLSLFFINIIFIGFLKGQSEIIFDEGLLRLQANAGPDIYAPSFSTIMLDASRSVHSKGSFLQYEWMLPPSLVFYDDYSYAETDTIVTHDSTDIITESGKKSWKSIATKSKYIEIDLPEYPEGTELPIILKVKDPLGFVDTDTVMVIFSALKQRPRLDLFESTTDSITKDNDKIKEDEKQLEDELSNLTKPSFLISIQSLNTDDLYDMESEMISAFLYNEIRKMGIKEVLDPNRFIPDSIIVKELIRNIKIVADTLIEKRLPLTNMNSDSLDTTIVEISDTTTTLDTLEYDQLVESILYYNFYCRTDSCAAENANIENATHVLSWGFNRYSELEIHYFEVEKYLNTKSVYAWTASKVSMDPEAQKELRYPVALTIDDDELVVTAANSQQIYTLDKDQKLKRLGRDIILGKSLLYPSGIVSDTTGRIFVSDKDNNRVFSIDENMATKLLDPKLNQDGSLQNNQPLLPTSVQLGSGDNLYILYKRKGTIIKVESGNEVTVVLKPGILKGAQDIAVNSGDTVFVVSSNEHKIYRVDNDSTIIKIAGTEPGDNLVRNNVPATQSYLGDPVSIDIDSQGNIYVADERFGLIRRINKDGVITSLVGTTNKINNMNQLRVSKGENPVIYITQALEHSIQRITLEGVNPWRRDTTILHPKYTIEKMGIYGLEPELRRALNAVLSEKAPPKKTTLLDRSRALNLKMMAFISRHPFLFAFILLMLSQGLSSSQGSGGGVSDLPPDFPF